MASRAPVAKEQRRLEIIAVSTRLLQSKGYGRTTMDDIAAGAGVTKRTLYRYVPTKQDILPMIHERFLEAAEERILRGPGSEDPVRQMELFIESYVATVVEYQGAVRVFFEEEYNLTPEARARIVARRDAFEQRVRDTVRDGVAAQAFRDCDVEVISAGILGGMASICRWYSPTGALGVGDLATLVSRLLLTGLTEPGRHPASSVVAGTSRPSRAEFDIPPPTTAPAAVLAAAVQLFAKQGYLETNTREIAEAAGITQSGLFYHIGSKEELLYAVQHRFMTESLEAIAQLPTAAMSAAEQLRQLIIARAELVADCPDEVRVVIDQVRYLTGSRRVAVEGLGALYLDRFEDVVRRGIALGVFKDLHPRVTGLIMLGTVNSMLRWYRPTGRLTAEQIGDIYADLLVKGLRTPA